MSYPIKKLGEIIKIRKGKKVNYSEKKGKYNYIDIGILRTGIIKQYTDDEGISCNEKNILIAWDGSKSGTVGFGLKGIIGSTLAKIEILDENICPPFLGKLLQSKFNYFNKNTSGAAIPHMRKEILTGLQIPLPPLPTQKLIVQKLDATFEKIDKQIALTTKNRNNLDELEKSVLEKVFSDESFEKRIFGSISSFVRGPFGGSLKKEIFKTSGYAVYEQMHAIKDQYNIIRYFIDENKFHEMKRFELKPGDLIMSCSGTMGKVSIVPNGIKQGIINQALLMLKPGKELFNEYLKYYMQSSVFQIEINKYSKGAAIRNIASVKTLKQIQIPLPSLPKQKEIVAYLDNIFEKNKKLKAFYETELKNLQELKQSLLREAFENENFVK